MIKAFLSEKFPQISEVLIDPEKTNKKAIYVYEKAGFKILGTFIPSHSPAPHVMMKCKRTGNDQFLIAQFFSFNYNKLLQ